jgi:DNA-binding MarR family transcriptional regulator
LTSREIHHTLTSPVSAKVSRDEIDRMLETWEPEIPGVDLEIEAAVQRINWIFRGIRRRMDETLADHHLSYEEWGLLGHLKRSGPPYTSTPGKLAQMQGLSSGAMTNRLDRLEDAGLIRRRPDSKDRRSLRVELTDKGQEVWLDTVHAQGAKEAAIGAALSRRELAQLNTLLRKVLAGFENG